MAYRPIGDYGIIGDMRSCALVGTDGSIDWMCLPRFDSPTVFARMLDDKKGGHFSVTPDEEGYTSRQYYWPDTNVLVTRMLGDSGSVELIDFMPVPGAGGDEERRQIIRRVRCVRGTIRLRVECAPAFDYARASHTLEPCSNGVVFRGDDLAIALSTAIDLRDEDGAAVADLEMSEGEEHDIVLRQLNDGDECPACLESEEAESVFRRTVDFWRAWTDQCTYDGRWGEMVRRSALALKLMTYEPTGAIIAAPTTSLPEDIGGVRNWDYRYTWIRDSAFTVYALLRLGFRNEAAGFIHFLTSLCHDSSDEHPLQALYAIDGGTELHEETLDHLDGYRGSKPVRIGNAAYQQLQIDIYGELLDGLYLFNKWGEPVSYDMWRHLRRFVDWVCDNWRKPDEGLWEIRGKRQHFTFSKLMCWVAVDRGIRLAGKRSFPAPVDRWTKVRDGIYQQIMERAWSEDRNAFRMHYDTDELDAANLIMPLVFFMAPTDPRMKGTLEAMMQTPANGGLTTDSLVYRYRSQTGVDGLSGDEGTFNMCTFWLIEALTRAGHFDRGKLEDARIMFERMLSFSNHLGLYSEETSLRGEALGNFPQAFTHISLISAAFNLNRALDA